MLFLRKEHPITNNTVDSSLVVDLLGNSSIGCRNDGVVTEVLTESAFGYENFYQNHGWPVALALVIAGITSWYLGTYLNTRGGRPMIDKAIGKEVIVGASSSLFFIPMHYWGPILLGIALIVLFTR